MTSTRRRLAAYLLIAGLDAALAGADRERWQPRRWVTKPLLMPLLAASDGRAPRALAAARAASWGGDVLLMRDHDDRWFRGGAASFAAAHAAYTAALLPHASLDSSKGRRSALVVAAVAGTAAALLRRDARRTRPDLADAVTAYSLVIGGMAATAAAVPTDRPGGQTLRAGALLFLVSDSLIGATTFTIPDAPRRLESVVMLTYTGGQLLLDRGLRRLTTAD